MAILDAGGGAVLHGESALAWAGLRGFDLRSVHVVRRRETTRAAPRLATLHRLRDLDERDVINMRGVPSVSPLRAIWSEASRYSPARLFWLGLRRIGRLLDDAHRAGLVTWPELHESIRRLAKRGRAGTRIMRALADERPIGSSVTESRNEDRFESILRRAKRARFERQRTLGDAAPIGRVDFRDPELPAAIEVNSHRFHTTPTDRAADKGRYQSLNTAGFAVGVIWEIDLWSDRRSVVDLVDRVRSAANDGRAVTIHSPSCPWPPGRDVRTLPRRRPPGRG